MKRKRKIINLLIVMIVGIIGAFVVTGYGSQFIKPAGNVIDETFVNQCRYYYVANEILAAIFRGMIFIPPFVLVYTLDNKPIKGHYYLTIIGVCVLLMLPVCVAIKTVNADYQCQEFIIQNKKRYSHQAGARGGIRVEYCIWLKNGGGNALHTSKSVYKSAEVGDDMYVIRSKYRIIQAFPVTEYECK